MNQVNDLSVSREFDMLCASQRGVLVRYALKNLARERDSAEDLAQDTLFRALAAWSRFEGPRTEANTLGWMIQIMKNHYITEWRKRMRHMRLGDERYEDVVCGAHGRTEDADPREAHGVELGDEVRAAIGDLPAQYREVLVRVDVNGEQYKDAAAALGLPMGTVMSRLHRARRLVGAVLADYAAERGICRRRPPSRSERRAVELADRLEASQAEQAQADSVDRVVAGDDDGELLGREPGAHALASW